MPRPNLSPFTAGVLLLIFGALSVQLGASIGTSIIPAVGVLGVVFARYTLQACVHTRWRGSICAACGSPIGGGVSSSPRRCSR